MPRPLLLLGADSRAARAVHAALGGDQIIDVGRRGGAAIRVERYEEVPEGAIPPGAVLINCVGTASGAADELQRINGEVALRWAEAARTAGARHFIQLSSLSVYGRAQDIAVETPEAPVNAYGRSKQAADRALRQLMTPAFAVTLLRTPILIGGGGRDDKLMQLVRLALRTGCVPSVRPAPERSMLSYAGLGVAIARLVREPVPGVVHAADPDRFTYELLRERLAAVTGRRFRAVPVPRLLVALARRGAPGIHARLLASSRLDPAANFLTDLPAEAGLAATLTRMILEAKAA